MRKQKPQRNWVQCGQGLSKNLPGLKMLRETEPNSHTNTNRQQE